MSLGKGEILNREFIRKTSGFDCAKNGQINGWQRKHKHGKCFFYFTILSIVKISIALMDFFLTRCGRNLTSFCSYLY